MRLQPELKTERLVLRAFTLDDVPNVKILAGDKKIADVTANIPHPYPVELARDWILSHEKNWKNKELASFAITLAKSNQLIGAISLINIENKAGELGYWIGVDYWNAGYCTEACRAMIDFGFSRLGLNKIHAHHLTRNPASGKVLLNSGLSHIGSSESICGYRKEKEPTEVYEISSNQ